MSLHTNNGEYTDTHDGDTSQYAHVDAPNIQVSNVLRNSIRRTTDKFAGNSVLGLVGTGSMGENPTAKGKNRKKKKNYREAAQGEKHGSMRRSRKTNRRGETKRKTAG